MKANITISVDIRTLEKVREMRLNVSGVCNDALAVAAFGEVPLIQQKITEIKQLEEKNSCFNAEKDKNLQVFLEATNPSIVEPDNEGALRYWVRKTGLSLDKLRELRKRVVGNEKS